MEETYTWHCGTCNEMIEQLRETEFSNCTLVDELRDDLRTLGLDGWILWLEDYADEIGEFATADERIRASRPRWFERPHRQRLALASIYRLQEAAVVYGLLEHYTRPSGGPAGEMLHAAGVYKTVINDFHLREWWPLGGDSPFVPA